MKFSAVYHTAKVYVNGSFVGGHSRSGYTPFRLDITDAVRFGGKNTLKVEVDNSHIPEMLPHCDDFDWADDGGMIRRVTLEIRGYVWFSLNDYRAHCGEEGKGRFRRRVHGSTDMYGNEKPSYRLLRELQKDQNSGKV